jgi:hypothetical protein
MGHGRRRANKERSATWECIWWSGSRKSCLWCVAWAETTPESTTTAARSTVQAAVAIEPTWVLTKSTAMPNEETLRTTA